MAYLLDTCTISEPTRKSPDQGVISFMDGLRPTDAFIAAATLAEVWKGIELLTASRRRTALKDWFDKDLLLGFESRILPIDGAAAMHFGTLAASLIRCGKTMPIFDALIAATALANDLTLVTRNESDFIHSGCRILNPWK